MGQANAVSPTSVEGSFSSFFMCHCCLYTGERLMTQATDERDTEVDTTDNKPVSYLCSMCDKQFAKDKNLRRHVRRIHTGEDSYACGQCGKRFSSQDGLRHHMYAHTTRYKCAECGKCCISSTELSAHRRSHSGEKLFVCSVCGRGFSASHQLMRHSRTHSDEKPYKCFVCDKVTTTTTVL